MKGIRRKQLFSVWVPLGCFALGALILFVFVSSYLESIIIENKPASWIFFIGMCLFALSLMWLGVEIFFFSFKTTLTLSEDRVVGRYGLFHPFSFSYDAIDDVIYFCTQSISHGAVYQLRIFAKGTLYDFPMMENAYALYLFLQEKIGKKILPIDWEKEEDRYKHYTKKAIPTIVLCFVFVTMLFINLLWCVAVTEGRELGDFTLQQNWFFVLFVLCEVVTFVLTVVFALIGGRANQYRLRYKTRVQLAAAYAYRTVELSRYGKARALRFFPETLRRVILVENENSFTLIQEYYVKESSHWETITDAILVFSTQEDAEKAMDEIFDAYYIEENFV